MAVNKIEATLKETLKQAIISCGFVEEYDQNSIVIEIPKDKAHGDYSTNLAMQLTKLLKRNPRQIAQEIVDAIDKDKAQIEKIEIAGPGFINLFLAKDAMTSIIKEVLTEKSEQNKSKKRDHKKFNVKKNLGRLVALIIVICLLLASSATLIFYLMWYLN